MSKSTLMKAEALAKWLQEKFLAWEQSQRKKESYTSFAKYIGITPAAFGQWVNGNRIPNAKNIHLLAAKLGPSIFQILEIADVSDMKLKFVETYWFEFPEEFKREIVEKGIQYLEDKGINISHLEIQEILNG